MKLLLALTWSAPFLFLSYLLGRAAAADRKSVLEFLGVRALVLLVLVLAGGLGAIATTAAMLETDGGGVDWLLLVWLSLAAVTLYVVGNDHQESERRLVELNVGKWLSISISAIALVLVSVLLTSLLIQVVEMFPRRPSADGSESWLGADWFRSSIKWFTASPAEKQKAPQAHTPAEFRAKLREQEAEHKLDVNRYLRNRKRPKPQPVMEEKSDPQRFSGWQLEPRSLVPSQVPGLVSLSEVSLGDNMYEAVFIPQNAADAEDDESSGNSIEVNIIVTKQDSPQLTDEYLQPVLNQYGFAADTVTVESRAVRVGFLGGYNGKTAVYQQAFIGWTSSLFSFEVVARTPGYLVTDKALLYGPALQAAAATLNRAEHAIAASKPTH